MIRKNRMECSLTKTMNKKLLNDWLDSTAPFGVCIVDAAMKFYAASVLKDEAKFREQLQHDFVSPDLLLNAIKSYETKVETSNTDKS